MRDVTGIERAELASDSAGDPEGPEGIFRRSCRLAATVAQNEDSSPFFASSDVVYDLFHDNDSTVLEEINAACRMDVSAMSRKIEDTAKN